MDGTKLSDMDYADELTGSEQIYVVQDGQSRKTTLSDVARATEEISTQSGTRYGIGGGVFPIWEAQFTIYSTVNTVLGDGTSIVLPMDCVMTTPIPGTFSAGNGSTISGTYSANYTYMFFNNAARYAYQTGKECYVRAGTRIIFPLPTTDTSFITPIEGGRVVCDPKNIICGTMSLHDLSVKLGDMTSAAWDLNKRADVIPGIYGTNEDIGKLSRTLNIDDITIVDDDTDTNGKWCLVQNAPPDKKFSQFAIYAPFKWKTSSLRCFVVNLGAGRNILNADGSVRITQNSNYLSHIGYSQADLSPISLKSFDSKYTGPDVQDGNQSSYNLDYVENTASSATVSVGIFPVVKECF